MAIITLVLGVLSHGCPVQAVTESVGGNMLFTIPDVTPPDVAFISPTDVNGTETYNKNYVTWNMSVSEDADTCLFEINGTNQTGTIFNNDANTYCYYNETGFAANSTTCAWGYANDTSGNLNMTLTYICRNLNLSGDFVPPVLAWAYPATNNTLLQNYTIRFNFSSDENLSWCVVEVNSVNYTGTLGTDLQSCTYSYEITSFHGAWIYGYGNDTSGNLNVTPYWYIYLMHFPPANAPQFAAQPAINVTRYEPLVMPKPQWDLLMVLMLVAIMVLMTWLMTR